MTTEHKDLEYLKGRFEDGDRPTGDDFARLIDSCHNTRHLTDTTITGTLSVQGGLTVDGSINTRDVAADGAKLDSLDSFVRSNSDSWEESEHILAVSSTVETVSSVLTSNINTLNHTLSVYIDDNVSAVNTNIDSVSSVVDENNNNLTNLIQSNHADINLRVDALNVTLSDTTSNLNDVTTVVATNSASWNDHTDITNLISNLNQVTTTVASNSGDWSVDVNTDTNRLVDMLDVDASNIQHDNVLKYNSSDQTWYAANDLHGEGHHEDTFIELHDTPVNYAAGQAGDFVKLNSTNNGLDFVSHDTDGWDQVKATVASNSASWNDHTDITNLTNTVVTNSASWNDHTDVTQLTTDITNVTSTVATNSASWNDHTDITDLTSTVATNSASWNDHTDVTQLTTGLSDVTSTVATNSASWNDHTDVTQLTTGLSDVTSTVATNSASWNDHTDITYLTSTVATNSASWNDHTDITNLTSTVATNSASWNDHTDITDLTNTVATNSASWAVLDDQGKLLTQQIPELSITQTYTVQNTEEVASLNPAEGIQRGDVIIVTSTYDNLIAKQDNPSGAYNSTTKTYSGYSKLARPDAYVTSVNDMYGNVTIESDDISDNDNDNKWVSQSQIDQWDNSLSLTGGELIGNLNTTASYLSGGTALHDIFSTNTTVNGDQQVNGDSNVSGSITTTSITSDIYTTNGQTGITENVNIGGHVLHIVNGIIVGLTDE
jgi:hypothetical protein